MFKTTPWLKTSRVFHTCQQKLSTWSCTPPALRVPPIWDGYGARCNPVAIFGSVVGMMVMWAMYPTSHNHGSVKNGCISNRIVTFQLQPFSTEHGRKSIFVSVLQTPVYFEHMFFSAMVGGTLFRDQSRHLAKRVVYSPIFLKILESHTTQISHHHSSTSFKLMFFGNPKIWKPTKKKHILEPFIFYQTQEKTSFCCG